jgi:hypothetical protein
MVALALHARRAALVAALVMPVGPIPESWLRELSPLDRLALEADVDPAALKEYLRREVERRRAEAQNLPPGGRSGRGPAGHLALEVDAD